MILVQHLDDIRVEFERLAKIEKSAKRMFRALRWIGAVEGLGSLTDERITYAQIVVAEMSKDFPNEMAALTPPSGG